MSAQNLVLIIAGAAAIIVVSVVATVFLLREPSSPPAAAETALKTPPATEATVAETGSSPVLAMPEIKPEELDPQPVAETASPAITNPVVEVPQAEATLPVVEEYQGNPLITPDDRIYAYIETLKVVGIRSSGANSKVLMNNRVYRVNDYVERDLMLRLVKVSSDSLTFLDANGIIYTKYF